MTTPPCRIGCGAYGASFVVAAAGTFIGGGTAGSDVADGFDASCAEPTMTEMTKKQEINSGLFMTGFWPVAIQRQATFLMQSRWDDFHVVRNSDRRIGRRGETVSKLEEGLERRRQKTDDSSHSS